MPKKSAKTTKAATKKKATTKRPVEKKVKAKTKSKKKEEIDPNNFLHKENESQLKSLITKEFDKELTEKSAAYIKSFVKIEDSIISVNDFLNYVENLDEDLFKLFKAYTNSSDNDIGSSSDDSEEEEKSTGVKSDDPVRMYLKEMGNVELLSREGEIAIAKRIESGLDKIAKSIDDASRMIGRRPSTTYFRIILPQIKLSILAGFFLVLVDTMKELPITLLLRPFNFNTLATSLYEYSSDELFELGSLHAFTIIIFLSIAIYFFDSFLEKKIVLKDKK